MFEWLLKNNRFVLCISVFLLCAVPLFANDIAWFQNLGFSANSNYFMFGQYGISEENSKPYAESYIIDVGANKFYSRRGGAVFSCWGVSCWSGIAGWKTGSGRCLIFYISRPDTFGSMILIIFLPAVLSIFLLTEMNRSQKSISATLIQKIPTQSDLFKTSAVLPMLLKQHFTSFSHNRHQMEMKDRIPSVFPIFSEKMLADMPLSRCCSPRTKDRSLLL